MRLLSTLNSRRDALRSLLAASLAAPLASPAQAICCDERQQPDQNPASVSHQPLQILCWNIHHGRGTDELINLERQAAVINSSAADAVALQEVDQNTVRSGRADQTAVLAKLTGLHGCIIITKVCVLSRRVSWLGCASTFEKPFPCLYSQPAT